MNKNRNYLWEARKYGEKLRAAYYPNTNKISGINYRLLNALKTGNRNMFMDLVLNCYMYVGEEVPPVITEIFREDDEIFSVIGYSFVSGFIPGNKSTDSDKESGNAEISSGEESVV